MLAPNPRDRLTIQKVIEKLEPMRRESPDWLKLLGVGAAEATGVALFALLVGVVFRRK